MLTVKNPLAFLLAALFLIFFLAGCSTYEVGFVNHPQIDSLAVGTFENATSEAALGTLVGSKIAEAVMRDGSVKLLDGGTADVVVNGRVLGVRSRQVAAVRGDTGGLSGYQSEYRSSLYRAYVVVNFKVVSRHEGQSVIGARTVTGEADYPNTPDMAVARHAAIEQAANDAARQIVAAITEAW